MNTEIDGHLAVSRNIAAGADASVTGSLRVGRTLRVDGWLDAPNIRDCCKGLFDSAEALAEAYPAPQPGWWAVVGEQYEQGVVYRSRSDGSAFGRHWEETAEAPPQLNVDITPYREDIDNIAAGLRTLQDASVRVDHNSAHDLSIEDESGNPVLRVSDGYPVTRNFNGAEAAELLAAAQETRSMAAASHRARGCAADMLHAPSLPQGSMLEQTDFPSYLTAGQVLTFSGDIASAPFTLEIGNGYGGEVSSWLEITPETVAWHYRGYDGVDRTMFSQSHNLTFSGYVRGFIVWLGTGARKVYIETEDGSFLNETTWTSYLKQGTPFMRMAAGALTDVDFGADCPLFRSPVWVFGDSYMGVNSLRVCGHLQILGVFDGILWDSHAGLSSLAALTELRKALRHGSPRFLVWMLGMNGGDASTIESIATLRDICADANIELILNDVPTTPAADHETLHAWIRASGIRYVDSYGAVGANASGEWRPGFLASDNIHPTEAGARALASRLLASLPELLL